MSWLTALIWFHTAISLVAIIAGFVVLIGLFNHRMSPGWTLIYLATALATSITGFAFPFNGFLPSHGVGIISLILLVPAVLACYVYHLAGPWRTIYAITTTLALYFLNFVLVAQIFLKVPALQASAPTQSEPPFVIAQVLLLMVFVVLTAMAFSRARRVDTLTSA
jgi:hypothetical protein